MCIRDRKYGGKIRELFDRLEALKASSTSVSLEFSKGLATLENPSPVARTSDLDPRTEALLDVSPEAAVTDSYRELEIQLRELAVQVNAVSNKPGYYPSTSKVIKRLAEESVIDANQRDSYLTLNALRNTAAHSRGEISEMDAEHYVRRAKAALAVVKAKGSA